MQTVRTRRVIIVGGGLAALYTAIKLAPYPVLVISPEALGQGASSSWAQGGVAAALGAGDNAALHALDTCRAGAGIVDQTIARIVTSDAQDRIFDLTDLGTPFDRAEDGGYALSREAAHSLARVVRVTGDRSGAEIMRTLVDRVRQTPSIQVLEGVSATALKRAGDRIVGVELRRASPSYSAPIALVGAACVLAGGGACGLYAITTNPPRVRGEVVGMAARAGAVIADPEFVQFHPTAIDVGEDPAPLATEALRGEGALLVNRDGDRFMAGVNPAAELAPRDVVARAVYTQKQAGMRPALDTREAIGADFPKLFPTVADICARNCIDPRTQPIPVAPAAHYHMGGVATDAAGRTSLTGLWACGEAASTGLHGANRLASNGLLEALVFAQACARDISQTLGPLGANVPEVALRFTESGSGPDEGYVQHLRRVMTECVGVVRYEDGLRRGLVEIERLEAAHPHPVFTNMTAAATLITAAALQRRESRGAHFRIDFPEPDKKLAKRTRTTLCEAQNVRTQAIQEVA